MQLLTISQAQTGIHVVKTMTSLQQDAIRRHQEVMELLSAPENTDTQSYLTTVHISDNWNTFLIHSNSNARFLLKIQARGLQL